MPFAPTHPAPHLHSFIAIILRFLLSIHLLACQFSTICMANRLQLPVGYRFSLSTAPANNKSAQGPAGEICIPLLSSDSYSTKTGTLGGFSFAIWAVPTRYPAVYKMYFCVCRIRYESDGFYERRIIRGRFDDDRDARSIRVMLSSSAMAIWNANASSSLSSLKASLVVGPDMALELKDLDGTLLWNVTDVSSMEMLDSGNLVIYNSANATVWESFRHPTDTLVNNQSLQVGSRLISNNSRYSMDMQPGGLVFSLLPPVAGPLPYWIIPALSSTTDVSKPPCNVTHDAYATLTTNQDGTKFLLYPGSCRPEQPSVQFVALGNASSILYDILQLQPDGRLHAYAQYGTSVQLVFTLDNSHGLYMTDNGQPISSPRELWGTCDVPLACGPSGICSSDGLNPCSCPDFLPYSEPVDLTDSSQGCSPSEDLRTCANESLEQPYSFLEIANMATIFVFSGETFNHTMSTLDECKNSCLSNCSCGGIVYMNHSSRCFPLDFDVSLLNVSTTPANQTAQNYVAYLKYIRPPSKDYYIQSIVTTVAVVVSFVFAILGLAWCGIALRRRSRLRRNANDIELLHILPSLSTRFSYRDLHKATEGFNRLLGNGGFGAVYAGVLPDGRKIAVKKLKMIAFHDEMLKQFLAEVATIGQTSHFNVVHLVGFCWESSNRSLVYEYMEKGSLDRWLFSDPKDGQMLDWRTRFNVAIGVSRGLAYLHEESSQPILHLDIKPQNILLDEDFTPKLADFGLSRLLSRDISQVITVVRGTPGYMAPELGLGEALSKKCDVYSLGMVLLEIVGGRKNVDMTLLDGDASETETGKAEEWHFPSWAARKCEEGKVDDLVDKRLRGEFQREEVVRMIEVAMWCIQENPNMRPGAQRISRWLEDSAAPLERPSYSTIAHAYSTTAYAQACAKVNITLSYVSASLEQSAR